MIEIQQAETIFRITGFLVLQDIRAVSSAADMPEKVIHAPDWRKTNGARLVHWRCVIIWQHRAGHGGRDRLRAEGAHRPLPKLA